MVRARTILAVVLASGASLPLDAQVCSSASVPLAITDWTQPVALPRFDPALGALQSVRVEATAHVDGTFGVENVDSVALQVDVYVTANFKLTRPNGSLLVFAAPVSQSSVSLGAYDGTLDFGGASGTTVQNVTADALPVPSITLTSGPDLDLFTGPAGNPGQVTLLFDALNRSYAAAPSHPAVTFATQASGVVTACYVYEPVSTSFCAGDGFGTACPCGNASNPIAGTGCLNSTGFGGHLYAAGAARIGADSFVLAADYLPDGTTALFLQGTARVNAGAGSVFGDGLRCAGGTVIRLGQKSAPGGVATLPSSGGPAISLVGLVQGGDVRRYQVWYRNVANFCTVETFNLTQALEVRWAP